MNPIFKTAQHLHELGIRVIPVRTDGTKAPAIRAWQQHDTTPADLQEWFAGETPRYVIGVATGTVSGNLEMTEIEGDYTHKMTELTELAEASGLAELWYRICSGWVEKSPSGGIHWIYRVEGADVPGNLKIAQAATVTHPDGKRTVPTIAETRGTGGQFVAAPSGQQPFSPQAHATGLGWERLGDSGPDTMLTLTVDERDAFHTLLSTLDEREAEKAATAPIRPGTDTRPVTTMTGTLGALETAHKTRLDAAGATPGDDFEEKNSWSDILEPHGWRVIKHEGATTYWCRPGKTFGISATTGRSQDRDRLYVFSSSTEFPTMEPITKFSAHTILNHSGDYSAAAKALKGEGYGERAKITHPSATHAPAIQAGVDMTPRPGDTPITSSVDEPFTTGGNVVQLPKPQPPEPHLEVVNTTLDLTDDSNAMALVRLYGERLRYHRETGRWLVWSEYLWQPQPKGGGYARELAKSTARQLPEHGVEGEAKTIAHKRYSLSSKGITSMLGQAQTDPMLVVENADIDHRPLELNTPGGIVDLTTGKLKAPEPSHMHSKATAVTPDAEADKTPWLNFLAQTFPDPEVQQYVQRLMGYSLIGEVRDHVLPFAYGNGGNGKGVFLETMKAVLGTYADSAPAGFLMAARGEKHPTELADFNGLRFVISSEVNQGDKFDEAKVKALTGGDTIKARFMGENFFSFEPTHTMWLMGNNQPEVSSGGRSFWRRLRLIPFTNEVPEDQIILGLQKTLARDHGPAVLQWAIEGAVAYLQSGLMEPHGVTVATQTYARSSDTVGRFLDEVCLTGDTFQAPVSQVRAAYDHWCRQLGEPPLSGRAFTAQLAQHGIKTGADAPRGSGGVRLYGGLMIAPTNGQTTPGLSAGLNGLF